MLLGGLISGVYCSVEISVNACPLMAQPVRSRYEEARSQLVSLSSSPADEEYFLSSRRFWSKEELGDARGGSSPPPTHRRPPGTIARGGGTGKRLASTAGFAVSGRGDVDGGAQRGARERYRDSGGGGGGGGGGDHNAGGIPPNPRHRGPPRPRQARPPHDLGTDEQEAGHTAWSAGSVRWQGQEGAAAAGQRGEVDVWSRPDRVGGGSSAALSCLTVDGVEQVLREIDPLPATVAVCAAVVFLLAPEDQPPADFLWPQGFEAVAVPAEDFLLRLHEASGRTASSSKARFLVPVLQREELIPEVIERQGGHAVARYEQQFLVCSSGNGFLRELVPDDGNWFPMTVTGSR